MKRIALILLAAGLIIIAYSIGREHEKEKAYMLLWEQAITIQLMEAARDMSGKDEIEENEVSASKYLQDRALSRLDFAEQMLEKEHFEKYKNDTDKAMERAKGLSYNDIQNTLRQIYEKYRNDYGEEGI